MISKLFNKTKVVVVIQNYCGFGEKKRVYDAGNGPFIYAFASSIPRYLSPNGEFEIPNYKTCNGDAVSWRIHKGNEGDLFSGSKSQKTWSLNNEH